jgi:hypothetical protein
MKYLRTKNQKEIAFSKESIVITSDIIEKKNEKINGKEVTKENVKTIRLKLCQNEGVNMYSPFNILIDAKGDLSMNASRISIYADSSIVLKGGDSRVILNCELQQQRGKFNGVTHILSSKIDRALEGTPLKEAGTPKETHTKSKTQTQKTETRNSTGKGKKTEYDKFLEKLAHRESGGKTNVENQYGFMGKYQLGMQALKDVGFYKHGKWTELAKKYGVTSKETFKNSEAAQEFAVREYHKKIWGYIKKCHKFVGTQCHGVKVTASGLLAATHLVGHGGIKYQFGVGKKYKGINIRKQLVCDGNNVPCTHYMELMQGFDLSGLLGYNPDKKQQN